jgi:hypothetical protein
MSIAVHKFGGVKNRIHNEQRIDGSPVTNIMPGRYEMSKLTQRKALKYQIRLEYPTRWLFFFFHFSNWCRPKRGIRLSTTIVSVGLCSPFTPHSSVN